MTSENNATKSRDTGSTKIITKESAIAYFKELSERTLRNPTVHFENLSSETPRFNWSRTDKRVSFQTFCMKANISAQQFVFEYQEINTNHKDFPLGRYKIIC